MRCDDDDSRLEEGGGIYWGSGQTNVLVDSGGWELPSFCVVMALKAVIARGRGWAPANS